ncbi:CHAP domain-containing protein [Sphingobacterium sp. UBA7625]|nr:CHAP domain-containing protein [Sphingobacterium sp. UBA7625]
MATMHSLFFGILFVAVLFSGGFGHRAVGRETVVNRPVHQKRIAHVRERIVSIAVQEIGVREATGNNDGQRVEEYLAYTGLGKGYAWCAAFVSWCYGKVGLSAPRNAWSPALFPNGRRYAAGLSQQENIRPADLFGIYSQQQGRINHVGIVRKLEDRYILTVEGNVANRVLSKRRLLATVYAFSNWLE